MNVNQYICTYIRKYIYILYMYHKSPESNGLRNGILDNFSPSLLFIQSIFENYGIKMTLTYEYCTIRNIYTIFFSGTLLVVFSTLKPKISFNFHVMLSSKEYAQMLNDIQSYFCSVYTNAKCRHVK